MTQYIKRALLFLTGNIAAQGVSAISGLLLVRWLSVSDYAIYTIMLIIIGAMGVLTKGGVHLGLSAILSRTWPDMLRAAEAIQSAYYARNIVSLFILPLILVVSSVLLWQSTNDIFKIIILQLFLIALWWADMRTKVVDQILFFAHQTTRVQILDTGLSFLRLITLLMLYKIGQLSILTAVGLAVFIALLRIHPILLWINKILPTGVHKRKENDFSEIKKSVFRQMPVEIFYVFQAQIILFTLTLFATNTEVAGYGALSRITQLLTPMQAFAYAFLVPIFARAVKNIATTLLLLTTVTAIPGALLIAISLLKPEAILWLIGPNYSNLQHEILLASATAVFTSCAGIAWSLVAHRGWIRWSWLQIPIGLLWCGTAPFVLDLGTINGALLLQAGFSIGLIVATLADLATAKKH